MPHSLSNFYINYHEKEVLVSPKISAAGNYFTVHLEEGEIKLKSEGLNKKLWIEKGKGATSLAYKLGELIESYKNACQRKLW